MEPKKMRLGYYRKVKTGCITCKVRKVKCDEAKPHCNRCTSTGRRCDGYRESATPDSRKRAITIMSPHSPGLFASDRERRSFSYFQLHAGKSLGGYFNQAFWGRQVMQAAIHYPSIRHLVIALGSAYESFEGRTASSEVEFIFQQSNASIKLLAASSDGTSQSRSQSPETVASVLTASILFIYLASIQGYLSEAVQHVQSAIRLLRDYDRSSRRSSTSTESSSPSPTPPSSANFPIPLPQLRSLLVSIYAQLRIMIDSVDLNEPEDMLLSPLQPATIFVSVDEAHSHVERLLQNMHAFLQDTAYRPPTTPEQLEAVVARHRQLCRVLDSSRDALDVFAAKSESEAGDPTATRRAITTLRLYHLLISVRLRLNVFDQRGRESAYDQEDIDASLRKMLGYCELLAAQEREGGRSGDSISAAAAAATPSCSSGLGYVMPLHMITARCRDPMVRRRALELLLRSRRTEGIWNGRLTGLVARETVAIEEECSGRVREVKVQFSGDRGAVVRYVTVDDWVEGKGLGEVRERRIEW
ncbi:hypothetical protein QBC42DRAFT_299643 [Cladorrhinum samala]|uniref:Zn(2)-C6 fungal-type domain-containing protein n=1 Tax=Cladorrhinum samala TaxID=585594 RepID=A0AAV9HEC1_9PEZI|nr:hypothetical protein QBC42DRAFT_299643 [Cladorrhinum samala]